MSKSAPDSESPRILIVRLSAIGDVIHTLPVLCALRRRFPDAHLAWVTQRSAATLLRGHEALDELIELDRGWLKSPGTVWRLRNRLRAMKLDVTIDAQGLTKSAIVAWLSGAARRIGFGDKRGRELSKWFYSQRVRTSARHVIDCNLELLRPLGISSPAVDFGIPEHTADAAAAGRMIRQAGLESRFCVINPGAGWPSKLWPAERYAVVARHLGNAWGMSTLVVWAGEGERETARQIVDGSPQYARLAPSTTLPELAAIARRARLFIASDTGPLHLAVAVGTPCVGLYGPWPAGRHGPYGPRHVALQEVTFEGSTRQRRRAPSSLMKAISVELVCEACDRILRSDSTRAA